MNLAYTLSLTVLMVFYDHQGTENHFTSHQIQTPHYQKWYNLHHQ